MIAPNQYLTNPKGQQEIVISTPYNSTAGFYQYNNGFYQTRKSSSTHPILERLKSEKFKQLLSYYAALPDLEEKQFSTVLDVFNKLAIILDKFQVINIVFERTPEDSLLVKGTIISDEANRVPYQLFLAIYFDDTESAGYEAILNVFNQRKQLLAASGELENITNRLLNIL
jgi:hypothetical protein